MSSLDHERNIRLESLFYAHTHLKQSEVQPQTNLNSRYHLSSFVSVQNLQDAKAMLSLFRRYELLFFLHLYYG